MPPTCPVYIYNKTWIWVVLCKAWSYPSALLWWHWRHADLHLSRGGTVTVDDLLGSLIVDSIIGDGLVVGLGVVHVRLNLQALNNPVGLLLGEEPQRQQIGNEPTSGHNPGSDVVIALLNGRHLGVEC